MNRKFQFWNTVRATFVEDFDKQLQKLEALGTNSSNDPLETPVECWSKAYFKGTSKCDVVDNNMAEAFNGWIIEARCKPIITMLEEIRTMDNTNVNVGLISTPRPISPSIRTSKNSNTRTSNFKKDLIHHPTTLSMTSQVKNMVESSATHSINARPSNKRKKVIGIGLYTDLQTGEKIMNPGMDSERVVTALAIVPKKIGAHTSQFQHRWKGHGLSWKGKKVVTTRQLQQENSDASRKHKIIRIQ
ncbi:hypothetical protein V6N13_072955 [Hibiscus sabdariffa]|uniref:Transposase n=1 Tax=Hibiscus sabdariffa TaxID=183260 RepID=A0ABR2E7N2_9ROSI